MTLPERYMKGLNEEVDTLRIFEIGGNGQISHNLAATRKAGNIIYREIHNPYDTALLGGGFANKEQYRTWSRQKLSTHRADRNPDELWLPWDGKDIPYPFETGYFDELHCHMITGRITSVEGNEWMPTIRQFAQEIGRLGASDSVFLFTAQHAGGFFFGGSSDGVEYKDFKKSMKILASELESTGFRTEVLQTDYYPTTEISMDDVNKLTAWPEYVSGLLIAKKSA